MTANSDVISDLPSAEDIPLTRLVGRPALARVVGDVIEGAETEDEAAAPFQNYIGSFQSGVSP